MELTIFLKTISPWSKTLKTQLGVMPLTIARTDVLNYLPVLRSSGESVCSASMMREKVPWKIRFKKNRDNENNCPQSAE